MSETKCPKCGTDLNIGLGEAICPMNDCDYRRDEFRSISELHLMDELTEAQETISTFKKELTHKCGQCQSPIFESIHRTFDGLCTDCWKSKALRDIAKEKASAEYWEKQFNIRTDQNRSSLVLWMKAKDELTERDKLIGDYRTRLLEMGKELETSLDREVQALKDYHLSLEKVESAWREKLDKALSAISGIRKACQEVVGRYAEAQKESGPSMTALILIDGLAKALTTDADQELLDELEMHKSSSDMIDVCRQLLKDGLGIHDAWFDGCVKIAISQAKSARVELIQSLEDTVNSAGHLETTGVYAGWHDTMALSTVRDAGDRLVELGVWERHPDEKGRRAWYRPLKKEDKKLF